MFLYAGMPIGCQLGHFDPIFVQSSHAFNSVKLFHCIAALEIILKEMEVVALLYLQTFFCNTEQWLQFHFKERTSSEEMNDFVR